MKKEKINRLEEIFYFREERPKFQTFHMPGLVLSGISRLILSITHRED